MDKLHHWTNHWETIAKHIAQRPNLLIASDFDGTLTPIARTPMEAVLPPETRTLLRRLAACRGVHLAIISGRALADIRMHVGIDGVFYAGNHGLEMSGPGIELHHPHASKAHGELEKAVTVLIEKTAALEGVLVEHKGASAAIHWRLASEESRVTLHELVESVAATSPRLRAVAGKCVWELRPKDGWHKGDALTHLAIRQGLSAEDALFLGDDVTDEDAFRALPQGLTFRVGNGGEDTAATFHIRDAADAQSFLLCVLGIRSGRQVPGSSPFIQRAVVNGVGDHAAGGLETGDLWRHAVRLA